MAEIAEPADNGTGATSRTAVAAVIAAKGLEHRTPPGATSREDEVGAVFGVCCSAAPAALQRRPRRRLAKPRRNRGTFMARPGVTETREAFEVRTACVGMAAGGVPRLQADVNAEHAAPQTRPAGRALRPTGSFHVEIARIARQKAVGHFVAQPVSQSSGTPSLCRQRRAAFCERKVAGAPMDAVRARDADRTEALLTRRLPDREGAFDPSGRPSLRGTPGR